MLLTITFSRSDMVVETFPEAAEDTYFTTVQFGSPEDAPEGMEDMVGVIVFEKVKLQEGRTHMLNHSFHLGCWSRDSFRG